MQNIGMFKDKTISYNPNNLISKALNEFEMMTGSQDQYGILISGMLTHQFVYWFDFIM